MTVASVVKGLGRAVVYALLLGTIVLMLVSATSGRPSLVAAVIMALPAVSLIYLLPTERSVSVYTVWFATFSFAALWGTVATFGLLERERQLLQLPLVVWGLASLFGAVLFYGTLWRRLSGR